ncbi:MAG: hypothetical protein A2Y89_03730, partial [Chloroflexi bacterium RBG_13_51_18]
MSRLPNIVIASLLVIVLALSFGSGFLFGQARGPINLTGIDIIDQAWNVINSRYVDPSKLNSENMSRAAIEGIIDSLDDPYTFYLTADELYQFVSVIHREYPGIGAYVTLRDGNLAVVAPVPGSPAERAGILPDDIVLEIDGESIAGLTLEEAVDKIKGPEGTTVKLLILHTGETEPVIIEVTRAVIELPSVVYEMRQDIAYISIFQFTERTADELAKFIGQLTEDNAKGIVLDLRDNGGGLLDAAVNVASQFLESGIVVTTRDRDGNVTEYRVNEDYPHTTLPMVVLVDENSASSSEVLAGALQDYQRATISGNTTYGKGSAPIVFNLKDSSALNVTIARWYTPLGRLIEGIGIEPDIKLDLNWEETIQWAIDYLSGNL